MKKTIDDLNADISLLKQKNDQEITQLKANYEQQLQKLRQNVNVLLGEKEMLVMDKLQYYALQNEYKEGILKQRNHQKLDQYVNHLWQVKDAEY